MNKRLNLVTSDQQLKSYLTKMSHQQNNHKTNLLDKTIKI